MFRNRWGKLYERNKRNRFQPAILAHPPAASGHSFRQRRFTTTSVVSVRRFSSTAGKLQTGGGTKPHQDLARQIGVVPHVTTILMVASQCVAKFQACPLGKTSTPWAISEETWPKRADGMWPSGHQLVAVGPCQIQLTLRLTQKPRRCVGLEIKQLVVHRQGRLVFAQEEPSIRHQFQPSGRGILLGKQPS